MQELSLNELEQVNGGYWDRVIGGVIGGIAGGYGAVLSSNGNYSAQGIITGVVTGVITGALNPVRSLGNAATTLAGSGATGGAASVIDQYFEIKE